MATIKGGDKLHAKLAEIAKSVSNSGTLRVGFLESATYPDGTQVAAVAAYNEFGTRTIPARPFFRTMIADKSPEWGAQLGGLLLSTKMDARRALGLMGKGMEGQLVDSIKATTQPPNAPSTIARKGFDRPLIDQGFMWKSVDSEVTDEGI